MRRCVVSDLKPRRGTTFLSGVTLMKVTSVRVGMVHYTYATDESNRGIFRMPLETWLKRCAG